MDTYDWSSFICYVLKENVAIGALLRNTQAEYYEGTLFIENNGSEFIGQMLQRPDAVQCVQQAANDYFDVPINNILYYGAGCEAKVTDDA